METKFFFYPFAAQRSLPLKEKENAELIQKGRHFYRERDTLTYLLAPIIPIQLIVTAFVPRGRIITKRFILKHC